MGRIYDYVHRNEHKGGDANSFRAEAKSARQWAKNHQRHGNQQAAENSLKLAAWADEQAEIAEREGR